MKYALVNPNWTFTGSTYFGCREPHLPLEYGYAKALLEREGHEVLIVDGQLDNLSREEIRNQVAALKPDFTVVTTAPSYLFWRCAPPELRVPQETVRNLRDIGGTMVAVGPHSSTTPKATLKKLGVDVVVMGECEEILPKLTGEWQNVPSICYWNLTQHFLEGLNNSATSNVSSCWRKKVLIFPAHDYPAYSTVQILEFLQRHASLLEKPLVFISFSAGVAGAIGAAWGWQLLGGTVKAFLAFDGWGVPLYGSFPIHRVSHDYFTHWSSALLGAGEDSFYAEPAVDHLNLWRSPHTCTGWWVHSRVKGKPEQRTYTTAAQFVNQLLQVYG